MIPDFPETSEIELPFAIAETITSWRRIFVGQDGADPRSLLRHPAADLWKTIEINQMVHPESHGAARQEAVDALQDMAEIGGIGPDDAQFIFAESFRASASDAAEAKKPNGGGRPHQPPVEVWPTMDDAAYHGLAGDVVKTIRPHTESDPVAILIQFLTCFGNVIGHAAYYQVESDRHHANLFAALVGQSSKARKGTAMGRVSAVAKIADNRARAEAQAVRLAMIYALLDRQHRIDGLHLKAALAVWEYCEASAAHIFGNALGDHVADEILRALQQVGENGMTRTAIRDLFARNQSGDRIGAALAMLMTKGRARMEGRESGGRPVEFWFATAEAHHG